MCVGGTLRRLARSFVGPAAVRTVEAHYADRVLLSVKGLTANGVMTDADPLEAEVKRAMIAQSGVSVLLVDDSKLSDPRPERHRPGVRRHDRARRRAVARAGGRPAGVGRVGRGARRARRCRHGGARRRRVSPRRARRVPARAAPAARVRFEHHREPLGIGERRPRVSWKVGHRRPGLAAVGVRDRGARAGTRTAGAPGAWTRTSPCSCRGRRRRCGSRERRAVRVRVWGPDGDGPSPWSDEAVVEAGLLEPGGLDGGARRAGGRRRAAGRRPGAPAAPRVRAARRRGLGAAVRHRPRRVRAGAQRRARRRPCARAGLDELRATGCATRRST